MLCHRDNLRQNRSLGAAVEWPGLVAFLVGLLVSVPFMDASFYEGPLAIWLHGADIAYYVGIVVAGVLYYVLARTGSTSVRAATGHRGR